MLLSSAIFVTVLVFAVVLQPLAPQPRARLLLLRSFSVISDSRRAAVVISGTELARQIQREIQRDVEELVAQGNMRPHLGVVLVGDDPASRTYVRNKTRAASILGKFALPVYVHIVGDRKVNRCCARASSVVPCRYFQ